MYEFDKHVQYAFTQAVRSSGHSFLLESEMLLSVAVLISISPWICIISQPMFLHPVLKNVWSHH